MIRLTSLEVHNSVFNRTKENTKFEHYTDPFDDFFFTELNDELEAIFGFSDISPKQLQKKKLAPHNNKAF